MKKLLLILILLIPVFAFCQPPKEHPKPVYNKFIPIQQMDKTVFFDALNQWKRLVMYDPTLSSEQKVKTYQDIETYMVDLLRRVRIDSVRVDTVAIKNPKK